MNITGKPSFPWGQFLQRVGHPPKRDRSPVQLTVSALNWHCLSNAEQSPLEKVSSESPLPPYIVTEILLTV